MDAATPAQVDAQPNPDQVLEVRRHAKTYLWGLPVAAILGAWAGGWGVMNVLHYGGVIALAGMVAGVLVGAIAWKYIWMRGLAPKTGHGAERFYIYFCSQRKFVYHSRSQNYDICSEDMENCREAEPA